VKEEKNDGSGTATDLLGVNALDSQQVNTAAIHAAY
jgi:hypothetical protein